MISIQIYTHSVTAMYACIDAGYKVETRSSFEEPSGSLSRKLEIYSPTTGS